MYGEQVQDALHTIYEAGGTPYIVGGAARDFLFTKEDPRDVDIEVFGLEADQLMECLACYGQVQKVGSSYGVYMVKEISYNRQAVEFSLPRASEKYGDKHNDCEVELDPFIDFRTASMRRDLTINSVGIRYPDGEVMDYWGGQRDWIKKVAHPVNPLTFPDDNLRVLRAAQFIARFGLKPHGLLTDLSIFMSQDNLSSERVYEEWRKLLMKGKTPAAGLNFLLACGWMHSYYPELWSLTNVHQAPEHHPEGTVWEHTCEVVNWASIYKSDVAEDWQEAFMYAALVHDIGKIEYTKWIEEKQKWQSGGHVASMLPLVVLEQITRKTKTIKRAMWLVKNHDRRVGLWTAKPGRYKAFAREVLDYDVEAFIPLTTLWKTDTMPHRRESCDEVTNKMQEALVEVQKLPLPITGKDIISMGVKPGPLVGEWLNRAKEIFAEEPLEREELLQRLEEEMENA